MMCLLSRPAHSGCEAKPVVCSELQGVGVFVEGGVLERIKRLAYFEAAMRDFHAVRILAELARCEFNGKEDWPPMLFVYSVDYRSRVAVKFSKNLWGKYAHRIQSIAGVIS